MLMITQVLKAILEDEKAVRLHVLVGEYLCASGPAAVFKALDSLIGESDEGSVGYREDLESAFGKHIVAATVDTVGEEWLELLGERVRTSDLDSEIGAVCLQTIVRADYMLSGMTHLPSASRAGIMGAVAEQCSKLCDE